MRHEVHLIVCVLSAAVLLTACQKPQKSRPDYNRPLPPGSSALRLILDPADWPDLRTAYATRSDALMTALDRSAEWFTRPSTKQHFPMYDVTHLRARASVFACKHILEHALTPLAFEQDFREHFNCYSSVGYDDRGTVLFTGYFAPIYRASRRQTAEYRFPLYRKPDDLTLDPLTGEVTEPFPTRRELETGDRLKGLELVWLKSRLDQYIIHVQGSAKLELTDGGVMYVGYAGSNGREYSGLGQTLLDEGVLEPEQLSLPAIRDYFRDKDDELERYINQNKRFIFFVEYDGETWPAGSLNVKVTPLRSLATDNAIFPRGSIVLVETTVPDVTGASIPFTQFMADQDTGGAIRAAGRADIYMGIGQSAGRRAGHQFAEGRLFYFFLKHEKVLDWHRRMRETE